ncbi:MAG: glycoside hydrolase family 3 C-terminal domain-containing protein [Bdellovibrionales bacterium]
MWRLLAIVLGFALPLMASADRVSDLVSKMTLEEKIALIGGDLFATKANARLGIPALKMTDGPLGARWQYSTAFPSGISMGASFNRDLVYKAVAAMGVETRAHGRDMLLGPCVGISRVPFGGRNFEGMGEDPFLTAELVASYVHALNDQKVVGSVKHFGLNDQEYNRMTINSVADERTMHEIHFVPFERAVAEGVGSVMASYNRLNGLYASENPQLLTNILKQQWGFTGFVISDWGATHSVVPAALAGLDLEMPYGDNFGPQLLKAVQTEDVPLSLIDDKVTRLLGQMFRIGLFDGADQIRPPVSAINSPANQATALQMARESHVLLKNIKSALPLDLKQIKKIAVIGPNADVYVNGGGSSAVEPFRKISTLNGLRSHVPANVSVEFSAGSHAAGAMITPSHLAPTSGTAEGLLGEYFDNPDLAGKPVFTRIDQTVNFYWDDTQSPDSRITKTHDYSIRWTGVLRPKVSGEYTLQTYSDDGVRLFVDGKVQINNWSNHGITVDSKKMVLQKGKAYKIRLEYFQGGGAGMVRFAWTPPAATLLKDAIALAAKSEVAIVHVGFNADTESEAQDREGFDLPKEQVELINAVAKVNSRTIVVINSGNPVAMGAWADKVSAIIYAWFPGQEGGNALADILTGVYNPSGRLPVTMLKRWEDSPAFGTYPEKNGDVVYQEGVYIGYRHFDKANIAPEYPFGYGLSYTSFLYSDLVIKTVSNVASSPDIQVTATVTNKGQRAGAEVVQLYVQDLEPKIDRPPQELKGFEKVFLQPGESRQVTFRLNQRSFAYYDVAIHGWNAQPGRFSLRLASSSRDVRLNGEVVLTGL